MAMRRALVMVCLLGGLVPAGCARTYWTKAGFNQADWNRDTYECERDMRQSGYYGSGLIGTLNAQDFFERCLAAKGYYKQAEAAAPRSSPAPQAPKSDAIEYPPNYADQIKQVPSSDAAPHDRPTDAPSTEVHIAEPVPPEKRDPNCIYSADGVFISCPQD